MADRFENKGAMGATIVVAAADSLNKAAANYVCSGVNDHVEIQAALDALPATGGEVRLLDGTYHVEVALVLDSYQTLRGCGHNTLLVTSTALTGVITATGGSTTEKTGILIADLKIDADSTAYSGILWNYVDYSEIRNVAVYNCSFDKMVSEYGGIHLQNCDFDKLIGNISSGNAIAGICLGDPVGWAGPCTSITINGNICTDNIIAGVYVIAGSNSNTIIGNTCQGNGNGIYLSGSDNNTISGNTCQGNDEHGIYLLVSDNNTISGNTCQGNDEHGIYFEGSGNNTVTGNTCLENSQGATNTWDDISLEESDYNNIQANTCRAGGLANVPRYGISIDGSGNLVIDNDLYDDGFGTAPFKDTGTGTKLSVAAFRFTEAVTGAVVTTSPIGVDVDVVGEEALTWGQLPLEVQQVVRIKIWAVSTGTPLAAGGQMHLEITFNAGASGEAYNLAANSWNITDFDGEEADYAADDVIHWVIEDGDVGNKLLNLLGGDSFELKAIGEGGANPDGATDAVFRVVEIEYV